MTAIILVAQFNSLYQAVLWGCCSPAGRLGLSWAALGLSHSPVIVVNNNIVLIDTYNQLKAQGWAPLEAALRTGAQRLRPVLLASVTTVLGLLPMVLTLNIDLINREITVGASYTRW